MRAYLDPKMADSTPAQAPARAGGWCISGRMQEIDSCATAVSVAVEEQSSATAEISQNVASASDGAKIVVPVLGEVSGAAAETRHSAENVLTASQALEMAAGALRKEVEGFLSRVAG